MKMIKIKCKFRLYNFPLKIIQQEKNRFAIHSTQKYTKKILQQNNNKKSVSTFYRWKNDQSLAHAHQT